VNPELVVASVVCGVVIGIGVLSLLRRP